MCRRLQDRLRQSVGLEIAPPSIAARLYDGSKHEPDACRRPHGQRPPEGDTYCARRDTGAAHTSGQRTQKREEQQRSARHKEIRLAAGTKAVMMSGIAAPTAKLLADVSAA